MNLNLSLLLKFKRTVIEMSNQHIAVWQVSVAGDVYGKDQKRRYYHFTTLAKAQRFIHHWIIDRMEITGNGPYDRDWETAIC